MKQAMIMPASFSTATLFPDAAMRVNLPAEPLSDVDMVENVSVYRKRGRRLAEAHLGITTEQAPRRPGPYRIVYHILCSCVVIYINRHPSQRRDFGAQLV
jgi:hypothetical protein